MITKINLYHHLLASKNYAVAVLCFYVIFVTWLW